MSAASAEMAGRDRWARADGIGDRERGYRLFENACDRVSDVFRNTQDPELAIALGDMGEAFFLVFGEKSRGAVPLGGWEADGGPPMPHGVVAAPKTFDEAVAELKAITAAMSEEERLALERYGMGDGPPWPPPWSTSTQTDLRPQGAP